MCYGPCRFCLVTGQHRDLMKEYVTNGTREVYIDLFTECFNIYLRINHQRSLICNSCIDKLKDASNFRTMVVSAEQQLVADLPEKQTCRINLREPSIDIDVKDEQEDAKDEDHLDNDIDLDNDDTLDNYNLREPSIEIDDVKEEIEEVMNADNHIDDDIDFDNDDTLDYCDDTMASSSTNLEDVVDGEAELLARFPRHLLRPLPTRKTLVDSCKQFVKELDSLKDKKITPKSIENLLPEPTSCRIRSKVTEKHAHIQNIYSVLKYSNLTAFKTRRRRGFPCYYCSQTYENFDILRDYQYKDRCKANLNKVLSKSLIDRLIVYVHVTEITCNICNCNVTNVNELKSHLTNAHNKKLHPEYEDRVIPFKLTESNEYECQSCGLSFKTFGAVERHMNVHYRNFVCDQCGAGYVTQVRLKMHLKCSHVQRSFPCDICKKVFKTQYKQKRHVDSVHKMVKNNKCPRCPETFRDYFDRRQHMVEAHGELSLRYKCNVCDSTFKRRAGISLHMKRRHLEIKDNKCHLCPYKCHTNGELKMHMIRHNGERTFECVVCKKSYPRKKTLTEHMRIHNNNRKTHMCVVCKKAFVQIRTLKKHTKAHHPDHYMNGLASCNEVLGST